MTLDEALEYLVSEMHLIAAQEVSEKLSEGAFSFGKYEQNRTVSDGEEAIQWMVIDYTDGKALLLSEAILSFNKWEAFDSSSNNWVNSDLRAWLQGDFAETAFTVEDLPVPASPQSRVFAAGRPSTNA